MWAPVLLILTVEGCLVAQTTREQGKNVEILHAVEDLIKIIRAHPLYDHLEMVSEEEVTKLKKHYNHFMYQVIYRYTMHHVDLMTNIVKLNNISTIIKATLHLVQSTACLVLTWWF